jgi:hypothetical protein
MKHAWLFLGSVLRHVAVIGLSGFSCLAGAANGDSVTNAASIPTLPGMRGTWVWSRTSWVAPAGRAQLFSFLKQHGLSVILIQIHTDYSGEAAKLQNEEDLSALLQEAAGAGVVVHALDGGPNFIYAPWPEKLAGQIRAVAAFNAAHPREARFAGVHYDIEPYTLAAFKNDETRSEVCRAYVATLKRLAPVAKEHGLEFSVDIPFWFDTNTKLKTYEQEVGHTLLEDVAGIVDWFGIMAYRNTASGSDGILAHSEGEVSIMEKLGKKAWIGVETGINRGDDPPKITFANRLPAEMEQELKAIEAKMAARKGYGGLLIHSYERYREYLSKSAETAHRSE